MEILLFVAFPLQQDDKDTMERCCLKSIPSPSSETALKLIIKALQATKLIEAEDYQILYDKEKRDHFIKRSNQADIDTSGRKRKTNPSPIRLLKLMENWKDFREYQSGTSKVIVNDVQLNQGIVYAYANLGHPAKDVIIDVEAINTPKGLVIKKDGSDSININVLSCTDEEVYRWFVFHRIPSRVLDTNYTKHTRKERQGPRGLISAFSYSEEIANRYLHWAIGSKMKNSNRLYFLDQSNNKLIVFWNENLSQAPTYHAFETDANDQAEWQKIAKNKDGQELREKIIRVSEIYE